MPATTEKTVYAYHPETGEYLGQTVADLSPLDEEETWLIPAHASEQEPPQVTERQVAIYRDSKWLVAADYRTVQLWSKQTAQPVQAAIGDTPDSLGATELAPPPFAKWAGNDWAVDTQAERAAQILAAEQETVVRRSQADAAITPLQDAVELEIATLQEVQALAEWKKYRVLLSRVSQQPGYPAQVEWPAAPQV